MARYTEVVVQCDACLEEGVHQSAVETKIAVGGAKPRLIALCDYHEKAILEPVQRLFSGASKATIQRKTAKPSEAPSKAPEEVSCDECSKTFSTDDGYKRPKMALSMHMRRSHAPEE